MASGFKTQATARLLKLSLPVLGKNVAVAGLEVSFPCNKTQKSKETIDF